MHVLILESIPADDLTGLSRLVDDAVRALVAAGSSVTLVEPQPEPRTRLAGILRAEAVSTTAGGQVHCERWPSDHWSSQNPERMHHAIEEMVRARSIERVVAVGIADVGHVAAAACRLLGVPLCSLLTWEDCHVEHLRHPQRFASVIADSSQVLVHTASSLLHLRRLGVLTEGAGVGLAPPRLDGDATAPPGSASVERYVCSTGLLDERTLLNEMMDRIAALVRNGYAESWTHLGTVKPQVLGPLVRRAAVVGLADRLSVTGWVPPDLLAAKLVASRGLIKPAGRVETGIGVLQANRWGVAVSVPPGYPVQPERNLEIPSSSIEPPSPPRPLLPQRPIAETLARFVA